MTPARFGILLEGRHYFRPFGGRKILYIWENVEQDMFKAMAAISAIPMTQGDALYA